MTFANFTYKLQLEGVEYELGLWDTIGQHDCDRLRPMSYPKTDVVLVGFAMNDPDSLDNVREKVHFYIKLLFSDGLLTAR